MNGIVFKVPTLPESFTIHTGHIFSAFLYASVPVLLFAPKGIVLLFIVAFSTALYIFLSSGHRLTWPSKTTLFFLVLAHFWGLLSCLWSEDPTSSLTQLLKILLINCAGLFFLQFLKNLTKKEIRGVQLSLLYSFVILTVFLLLEFEFKLTPKSSNIIEYNKSITFACFLLCPLLGFLINKKQYLLTVLLFLISIITFVKSDFDAVKIAMLFAVPCFILSVFAKEKILRIGSIAFLLLVISCPWLFLHVFNIENVTYRAGFDEPSWNHRLLIYKFTSNRVLEKPILGHGLNSSRSDVISPNKILAVLSYKKSLIHYLDPLPLHPHNIFLQWWLELGAIGASFIALLFSSLLWRFKRKSSLFYGSASALTATTVFIGLVSFGAWQSWFLTIFWVALLSLNILTDEKEYK